MTFTIAGTRAAPATRDPLHLSAAFWLAAMLLAQWAFFYYIAAFYDASIANGDLHAWNRLAAFGRKPCVPGDTFGNAAFAGHALARAGVKSRAGRAQAPQAPQARACCHGAPAAEDPARPQPHLAPGFHLRCAGLARRSSA